MKETEQKEQAFKIKILSNQFTFTFLSNYLNDRHCHKPIVILHYKRS